MAATSWSSAGTWSERAAQAAQIMELAVHLREHGQTQGRATVPEELRRLT